jgi:hypothetical protein
MNGMNSVNSVIVVLSLVLGVGVPAAAAAPSGQTAANVVVEVSFQAEKPHPDPFGQIDLEVVFTEPGGGSRTVPAFWAGGDQWKARYASPVIGVHLYRTQCSDTTDAGLHGVEGQIEVSPYTGPNALFRHGPIRVDAEGRHFAHADGTPFFWLGDTWWKNLCQRMTWEGFQELSADRKAKGFSVIQIVCGPYPDEGFFEPRWENEGGMPSTAKDFSTVNPAYFEFADRRLRHIVDSGMVPAIVGAWGRRDCDAMQAIGNAGLKRHWRNLVARYAAYPVVWILAGEIGDEVKWGSGPWAELAAYVRRIDPYHRPLTCHTSPGQGRRGADGDVSMIDFDMVGGNHDAPTAVSEKTLAILTAARAQLPPMPVLVGETCYEGHMQQGFQDVQRHMFWMYLLSGAAGHTYGAAGVWHASVEGDPGVANVYDWTTWQEGMHYPGSTQLGMGKKLLEQYPWWRFEPHPEWVDPGCYAAGIPGEVCFVYQPRRNIYNWDGPVVKNLDPGVEWLASYFDPATGRTFDQGVIPAQAESGATEAQPVVFKRKVPSPQDWVLVLERAKPE